MIVTASRAWGERRAVSALLDVYGHKSQVALAECDALYAEMEATAAQPTHPARNPALEAELN